MSSKSAVFGGVVGFSIVAGIIIAQDKGLRREASDQMRTVLKTTGKLVKHYRNLGNTITGKGKSDSSDRPEWDRIVDRVKANQASQEG